MTIRPRATRWYLLLLVSVAVLVLSGCRGKQLPHVVSVTGTVVYQGQPLAGATVMFVAEGGRLACGQFASALTGAQGEFRLTTQVPGNHVLYGAIPGEHRVIISKFVPPSGMSEPSYRERLDAQEKAMAQRGMLTREETVPSKVELLPVRYSDAQQTTLSALVKGRGPNHFTFALTD